MEIKFKNVSNKLYVYLYGELDECASKSMRSILDNLLNKYINSREVVFNLSNLTFMDSTGLGLLIGRYKKLQRYKIPAFIENPPFDIEKILELSGIYNIMPKK